MENAIIFQKKDNQRERGRSHSYTLYKAFINNIHRLCVLKILNCSRSIYNMNIYLKKKDM